MTKSAAPRKRIPRDLGRDGAAGTPERKRQLQRAAQLMKHVADPTRLTIILMLAEGEQKVSTICSMVGQSQPAVSHHLALLRVGGVIEAQRAGKTNIYSLTEVGESLAEVVREVI